MEKEEQIAWLVSAVLAGFACFVIWAWVGGSPVESYLLFPVVLLLLAPALVKCGVCLKLGWCEFGKAEMKANNKKSKKSEK